MNEGDIAKYEARMTEALYAARGDGWKDRRGYTYRDVAYVTSETESLARQLRALVAA